MERNLDCRHGNVDGSKEVAINANLSEDVSQLENLEGPFIYSSMAQASAQHL